MEGIEIERAKIRLYNEDCLPAMRKMRDNQFDLAIVDPEYGIGMDGGNVGYKGFNNFEKKGWDKKPADKKYFNELFRISKNQIVFGGNYFGLRASRCWLVWDKGEGFKNRTYAEAELAWTSLRGRASIVMLKFLNMTHWQKVTIKGKLTHVKNLWHYTSGYYKTTQKKVTQSLTRISVL